MNKYQKYLYCGDTAGSDGKKRCWNKHQNQSQASGQHNMIQSCASEQGESGTEHNFRDLQRPVWQQGGSMSRWFTQSGLSLQGWQASSFVSNVIIHEWVFLFKFEVIYSRVLNEMFFHVEINSFLVTCSESAPCEIYISKAHDYSFFYFSVMQHSVRNVEMIKLQC